MIRDEEITVVGVLSRPHTDSTLQVEIPQEIVRACNKEKNPEYAVSWAFEHYPDFFPVKFDIWSTEDWKLNCDICHQK